MEKYRILVVDDEPVNLKVMGKLLQSKYKVLVANSGEKAIRLLTEQEKPDLILLDIEMPVMNGYEVCRRIKSIPGFKQVPVIFVTAKNDSSSEEQGLKFGAVDYISKPIVPAIVLARISTHLALYNQNLQLENLVRQRTQQLSETRLKVIQRLGRAAEYRDNETGMHVIRMATYCRIIAEAMQITKAWSDTLYNAAAMHDVGKIGIPDQILLKPGKLEPEEWKIMQTHAAIGAEIIGDKEESELFEMAASTALTHHEKWDGEGYPSGLAGEQIPLEGRIAAVADVFDALTSERPYKSAWTVEEAVDYIREQSGKHFDPAIVDVFMSKITEIKQIKEHHPD
jgi:putative two-component system response regulator